MVLVLVARGNRKTDAGSRWKYWQKLAGYAQRAFGRRQNCDSVVKMDFLW
jgi:phage terminase large subunit-like protein